MAKAELKTKKTEVNPLDFINSLANESQKNDSMTLLNLFNRLTKEEPKMWGSAIIGYGNYTYHYSTGRSGDWFNVGFSPRSGKFSIYLMSGFSKLENELQRIGKYKTGKGCLYINSLKDVDIKEFENLIKAALKIIKNK